MSELAWLLPLGLLALWLVVGLLMEAGAWVATGLARRRPPPGWRAPPRGASDGTGASLAFLGDMQRGVSDVARPLAAALRNRPADLLVSTGDFAAHAEAPYYGVAVDALDRAGLDVALRVVPGNHDLFPRRVRDPSGGYALFRARFGEPCWSVEVGPVLVVGLDDALGPVADEQMGWLRGLLESRPDRPWIAACHRPPRNLEEPDARAESDLVPLVDLLERRPPLLVVSGHKHEYAERRVNGVLYVVNAHGGDVHGLALSRGPFDLLRVEVAADGSLRHEVTRHARRRWLRVYLQQLAVRCWASRRRGPGAWLAGPAALLLRGLGWRAPRAAPALDPVPSDRD